MILRERYMNRIRPFIGSDQGDDRHAPQRQVGHAGTD